MIKLRYKLAINILWLSVLFNLERLSEPINIATFVYILIPLSIVLLATLPFLRKDQPFIFFLFGIFSAYFLLKVMLRYDILGQALPITVLEILVIFISLRLFQNYMIHVFEFDDMIQKLTFRQLGIPPKLYSSKDSEDLYREIKRSRRFEHPLSLYILEPDTDTMDIEQSQLMKDLQVVMVKRFMYSQLASIISNNLRDTDIVVQDGDGFALLFPETGAEEASQIIAYVCTSIEEELGIKIKTGKAQFPDNAITLNGLFEEASINLKRI